MSKKVVDIADYRKKSRAPVRRSLLYPEEVFAKKLFDAEFARCYALIADTHNCLDNFVWDWEKLGKS